MLQHKGLLWILDSLPDHVNQECVYGADDDGCKPDKKFAVQMEI